MLITQKWNKSKSVWLKVSTISFQNNSRAYFYHHFNIGIYLFLLTIGAIGKVPTVGDLGELISVFGCVY